MIQADMRVTQAVQRPNGLVLFDVEIGDQRYEVWGGEVRLVRTIHGSKQYTVLKDAELRARIVAACVGQ